MKKLLLIYVALFSPFANADEMTKEKYYEMTPEKFFSLVEFMQINARACRIHLQFENNMDDDSCRAMQGREEEYAAAKLWVTDPNTDVYEGVSSEKSKAISERFVDAHDSMRYIRRHRPD